jgi:GntR family transcriptional repressor for pyruvate dehydrogenase complex
MLQNAILQYIVAEELQTPEGEDLTKLPSMGDLARELRVSRGKLREELIAAQACGAIEMRPGDGTYVRPFDFYAAVRAPILYSIACDRANFDRVYRLRSRLEIAFWDEAVRDLVPADHGRLYRLLERAERKLASAPPEIPDEEHRQLHLAIYARLDNEFVQSLLRVYWDAYEAVGLHRYHEFGYYERMWAWHREMVDAIAAGRCREGRSILIQHFTLLEDRLQGREDGRLDRETDPKESAGDKVGEPAQIAISIDM